VDACSGCQSAAQCEDGDPCTTFACSSGACTFEAVAGCAHCTVDAQCDDGDPCSADACDALYGTCTATLIQCEATGPCTVGECVPGVGCKQTPIAGCVTDCGTDADCEDGQACTTDACAGGTCVYTPIACDDADACTADYCDPGKGACEAAPIAACDGCQVDADCGASTLCVSLHCDEGACRAVPLACVDEDPCTANGCNPASGCVFTPVPGCTGP
jgi:hypothetical protein